MRVREGFSMRCEIGGGSCKDLEGRISWDWVTMGQIRAAAEVRRDGMDGVRDELDGLGEAENERREFGTGISFSRGEIRNGGRGSVYM